jgi:hypothetical protein
MKKTTHTRRPWLKIAAITILSLCVVLFYSVNSKKINHKIEIMLVSSDERVIIYSCADNFRFIEMNFGKDVAEMNYIKIMQNRNISSEVGKIVRLAYGEYLKD